MPIHRDNRSKQMAESLALVDKVSGKIGVNEEEGKDPKRVRVRDGETYRFEDDPSLKLAEVATWNEYGTDRIPARPAFRASAKHPDTPRAIAQMVHVLRAKMLTGALQRGDILTATSGPVQDMADNLKRAIVERTDPENAPLTVANKGFNDPLVDTGQLNESITGEVSIGPDRLFKTRGV